MPAQFDNDVIHKNFEAHLTYESFAALKAKLKSCHIQRQYLVMKVRPGRQLCFRSEGFDKFMLRRTDGFVFLAFMCREDGLVVLFADSGRVYLLVNHSRRQRWLHISEAVAEVEL